MVTHSFHAKSNLLTGSRSFLLSILKNRNRLTNWRTDERRHIHEFMSIYDLLTFMSASKNNFYIWFYSHSLISLWSVHDSFLFTHRFVIPYIYILSSSPLSKVLDWIRLLKAFQFLGIVCQADHWIITRSGVCFLIAPSLSFSDLRCALCGQDQVCTLHSAALYLLSVLWALQTENPFLERIFW